MLLKRIEGFNHYWISLKGDVWSTKTNKFLKPRPNGNGYYAFQLCKNNTKYTRLLHRLIAQTFIPNPNNFPVVDHWDKNTENNSIENLRWTTIQGNGHNKINSNKNLNIYH